MRTWELPFVEELDLSGTAHNGTDYTTIDRTYRDDKDELVADYNPS